MTGPLAGLRVLDVSSGIAGGYCSKMLADSGAVVVKVEPPGGDATRTWDPSPYEGSTKTAGMLFQYLHAGKKSVVLTPDPPKFDSQLRRLILSHDVVIESDQGLAAYGLNFDALAAEAPNLIWLSITPFGATGPYKDYLGSDLVIQAMSGWMYDGGAPDREPLKTGGSLSEYVTGVCAALAVAAAWTHRQNTGEGQYVDLSALESVHSTTGYAPLARSFSGERSAFRAGQGYPFAVVPCADGWVGVNVLTPAHWETLCAFMQRPELLDDPRFASARQRALESAALTGIIFEWTQAQTSDDLFVANEWRLPITKLPDVAEILDFPQHRERGFLAEMLGPSGEAVRRPIAPFQMSASPISASPDVPPLGAHTKEVLAGLNIESAAPAPTAPLTRRATASETNGGPLAGLRIIDLSMWWAGPFCTALLGDLGADVIKVESSQVIDGWRGAQADPNHPQWWEVSALFAGANRNKRGITLNLHDARGIDLLKRLVADADVVVENYTPRVMDNFGLGFDKLRTITPDLIMISLPAYGSTGPWRDYGGFAFPVEEMSGFPQLTGYADDGVPRRWGNAASDAIAGMHGTYAVLAALEHRRRTGEGQAIDLSQIEALTCFLGEPMLDYQVNDRLPRRWGNGHGVYAPHGLYPTAAQGEYIAISVVAEEQWSALCRCLGRADWLDDERFATPQGRHASQGELDAGIAEWCQTCTPNEAASALQAAGVPASPVLAATDLLDNEQLVARGYFEHAHRPEIGPHTHGLRWAHFSRTPVRLTRAAPTLGEHNAEVLHDLLGLTETEIAALAADQVIGWEPVSGSRI